jgi:hypothetical protein
LLAITLAPTSKYVDIPYGATRVMRSSHLLRFLISIARMCRLLSVLFASASQSVEVLPARSNA